MITEELDEQQKQKSGDATKAQGQPVLSWEESQRLNEDQPTDHIPEGNSISASRSNFNIIFYDLPVVPEYKKEEKQPLGSIAVDDDFDSISAVSEEKTNEDDFDDSTDYDIADEEDDDPKAKVTEQFEKLASFKGFKSWYGGELKELFEQIEQEDYGEKFIEDLKNIIIPIKALTGAVKRNEFSEQLGDALMDLYNALTAFHNFITTDDEDRSLETPHHRDQEFKKLNETATKYYEPQGDELEKIKDFFEGSVSEAVDSLIDAYDDIEKRINHLETEKKEESAAEEASIDFTASTRRNQEIISELDGQGIINAKNWKYKKKNITSEKGLKKLEKSIKRSLDLISNSLKILSSAQSVIFTGKLSESIETVKEIADKKKYFRSLNETLKESASQLDKYIANPDLQEIKNTDKLEKFKLEKLAPFIINMDEIVVPILNKILELNEEGSLDFDKKYTIKGNYRFNDINEISLGEDLIIHDEADRVFNTEKMLGPLVAIFIRYLHDPKSVDLTKEKLEQELDISKMDDDHLFAFLAAVAKEDAEQPKVKQKKEEDLRKLLYMQYILADKESLDREKDLLEVHHSPAGKVDHMAAFAETSDYDSDRSLDTGLLPSEEDEDEHEKRNSKETTQIEFRTMLRVIGLIAKKYGLDYFVYEPKNDKGIPLSITLISNLTAAENTYNGDKQGAKMNILKHAHKFVKTFREKFKDPNSKIPPAIEGLLQCIEQYNTPKGKPPRYDNALKKFFEYNNIDPLQVTATDDKRYYDYGVHMKNEGNST